MNEIKKIDSKSFKDDQGEKQTVAFECKINERTFVITADKKIFEKVDDSYKECTEKDEETKFLSKYLKPSKSLDVIIDDDIER